MIGISVKTDYMLSEVISLGQAGFELRLSVQRVSPAGRSGAARLRSRQHGPADDRQSIRGQADRAADA